MKNEIAVIEKIKVFERDGKQWTTSLNVAEVFGKEHFVVLKAIENLECSKAFADNNFIVGEYADKNNQMRKMYEMTRDGFSFLVMGFTGAKAAQFKEAYIEAFNRMEEQIRLQIDANDKMLITQDRYMAEIMTLHQGQMEIQRGNQELLQAISNGVFKIGEQVEKVTERVSNVEIEITDLKTEFTDLKNVIPIPRNRVSQKTKSTHAQFVFHQYGGKCPLCGEQIIGADRNPKAVFQIDHQFNRQESALDKTWGLCGTCNRNKSNGKIPQSKCQIFFDYYQENLKVWIEESKKQISLFPIMDTGMSNA